MTDKELEDQQPAKRKGAGGLRSTIALTIALLSLAVAGIAWFWTARLAQDVAMLNGVIAGSVIVCVTSVIAYCPRHGPERRVRNARRCVYGLFR